MMTYEEMMNNVKRVKELSYDELNDLCDALTKVIREFKNRGDLFSAECYLTILRNVHTEKYARRWTEKYGE